LKITREMLKAAKNGDEKAMSEVYKRVCFDKEGKDSVEVYYRKFKKTNSRLERDDVQGDLNKVLWKIISRTWWSNDKNIDLFVNYVWSIVNMKLVSRYRKNAGTDLKDETKARIVKFHNRQSLTSLNENGYYVEARHNGVDIEKEIEMKDLVEKVKAALMNGKGMRVLEYVIFGSVLNGVPTKELAKILGVTPQTVRNKLRLINHLAERISNG